MRSIQLLCVCLCATLSCAPKSSEGGKQTPTQEGKPSSKVDETPPAPPHPPAPPMPDCSASLCGCWGDAKLEFRTTVTDAKHNDTIEGVEVTCLGEDKRIAVTDSAGVATFSIDTQLSPGCGYGRCNNLKFSAIEDDFVPAQFTVAQANGKTVSLMARN